MFLLHLSLARTAVFVTIMPGVKTSSVQQCLDIRWIMKTLHFLGLIHVTSLLCKAAVQQREGWLNHLLMRQDISPTQSSGLTSLGVYNLYKILQHTPLSYRCLVSGEKNNDNKKVIAAKRQRKDEIWKCNDTGEKKSHSMKWAERTIRLISLYTVKSGCRKFWLEIEIFFSNHWIDRCWWWC